MIHLYASKSFCALTFRNCEVNNLQFFRYRRYYQTMPITSCRIIVQMSVRQLRRCSIKRFTGGASTTVPLSSFICYRNHRLKTFSSVYFIFVSSVESKFGFCPCHDLNSCRMKLKIFMIIIYTRV